MTTAPDLPLPPALSDPRPAVAEPVEPRPNLVLVPSQPASDEEIELDEALRRAGPRLRRYAARRLHDEHEAEEVVQEALLRAFQHQHLLATEDDLMAWLTVVTGRLVIDRLRVRGRSTPVADLPPAARSVRDTADVVVARAEARLALDALESMPGRQAAVLWAREIEGLSYDEIGERFAMSEPSVRSLLHRARRTLRREYASRGGSLPGVGLVALAPWLSGLRAAGRVRHVVRRGAGAAAMAATGLAMVTVPFGAASPVQAAPAMRPAIGQATTLAAHHVRAGAPGSARLVADLTPSRATQLPATPATHRHVSSAPLAAPSLCTHRYTVNCSTHTNQTLYVGPALPVPVAGVQRVGVSSTKLDCSVVPTTAVTQCDTRGAHQ